MRTMIAGILFAVCAAAAAPAAAICSCQCIEGVARTLCSRPEEARENPSACGIGAQKIACVAAPPPADPPERYAPPDGGRDCRSQRLWDPHTDRYSVVAKVCDLDVGAAGRD